jgi:hypothetical protein
MARAADYRVNCREEEKAMRSFTLVFLLSAGAAFGEGDRGVIDGTVLDPVSGVHRNAPVQAKNVATGAVYKAASSTDGKYRLAELPAGKYDVTVAIQGLRPFQRKDVTVEAAKTAHFDIHLEEGTQLSTLGEDPTAAEANAKRHNPPSGPTPRTADGKPDLSGVWWRPNDVDPGKPEWLPWAEKVAKQRNENNNTESPQAHCLPSAVTRLGPLYEFVQSQAFLVLISDDESPGFHQIYLDGRSHPKEPNPAWYGHSIGRWEGDTLVVDRVGFMDQVWLDQQSHPHTDKLHVIERYKRPDLGHLETEITVIDPETLAKPWTIKRVSDLAKDEISEFICTENNRDVEHMVGK